VKLEKFVQKKKEKLSCCKLANVCICKDYDEHDNREWKGWEKVLHTPLSLLFFKRDFKKVYD
jgi:hypothetical protein